MTAHPSQIRAYRILSCLAILHSALILGLRFGNYEWSWLWLGLATSLFLWLLVLAIHPGRSILRFIIPAIIATALFVPCAPIYGLEVRYSFRQWSAANNVEKLLSSNPRIILYSIDADHRKPLEVKKGYRRLALDETILPDDMFQNFDTFARMDSLPDSIVPFTAPTVNGLDEILRSGYGSGWQILRKEPNGSNQTEAETEATPAPGPNEFDREPYKARDVWGYVEITDRVEQRALLHALASSARYAKGGALCHIPRHGLYLESSTSIVHLTICFECRNVYWFGSHDKTGPLDVVDGFDITRAAQPIFDAALKRHGVPIP